MTQLGSAYVRVAGDFTDINTQAVGLFKSSKWSNLGKVAGVGLAAGLAAGGAAKAIYDLGSAFDDAFDKIQTRTGATGKELGKLEGSFKKVLGTVPTDFDTASEAVAGLNQRLGITGKPLTALSRQLTQLSKITGDDISESVESATRLFGDWSVKTKDQTETLDGLFRVSQQTGESVSNLARDVVQFGAPLRNLGFSLNESVAMFGLFEKAGVNTSTVLSGLRLSVGNLAEKNPELAKQFKELGISTETPRQTITDLFKAIETLNDKASKSLAMEVFGKRAGSDLRDAVLGGKFAVDDLIKTFDKGPETIGKAERSTRDFSEQWTLFTNRIKVLIEPVATGLFKLIGEGMKALNKLDLSGIIKSLQQFWEKAGFLRDTLAKIWDAIKDGFQGLMQAIKGIVKVISGVLTGDFGRAWDGVKDIFHGAMQDILAGLKLFTAPIRAVAKVIGGALSDIFGGAWDKIEGIFESGKDAVIGFLNLIIKAINLLPLIPDIGLISTGGGGHETGTGSSGTAAEHHYSGGKITRPTAIVGEEAPRHPEYVLATNPAYRERNLALWQQAGQAMGVPGFAEGGVRHRSAVGSALDTVTGSAGDIIAKLPSPSDLPGFFQPMGEGLIDKATAYIKDKFVDAVSSVAGSVSNLQPAPSGSSIGKVIAVGRRLQGLNFEVGENPAFGGVSPVHVAGSYHYSGRAIDINDDAVPYAHGSGEPGSLDWLYPQLQAMHPTELLWRVPEHFDHIHLAFREGGVLGGLQRLAGGGVMKQSIPSDLAKYNHTYPSAVYPSTAWQNLTQLPFNVIAGMAEWAGGGKVPGVTMAQVNLGEGASRPGSRSTDRGYGLWAITQPYADNLVGAFGGYPGMNNPISNALVMAKMYLANPGNALGGTWHGDSHVTDPNAHYKGSIGTGATTSSTGGSGGGKPEPPPDPATQAVSGGSAGGTGSGFSTALHKLLDQIRALRHNQPILQENFDTAQTLDSFVSSEMGVDLSPKERAGEVKLATKVYEALVARAGLLKKAVHGFRGMPMASRLSEELVGLQGITGKSGEILQARQALDGLLEVAEDPAAPTVDYQALSELRQQRIDALIAERFLTQSQLPIFGQLFGGGGLLPAYHTGGIVGERPVMAQDGEGVFTAEQMEAMGGAGDIHNHFYIDGNEIRGVTRLEVDEYHRAGIRRGRRMTVVPGG